MREFTISGSPFEIGYQHGSIAKKEVLGSLSFYTAYYERKARMDWAAASKAAENFLPLLERDWPEFVEEMKGVGEGAGLPFLTVLAMNLRQEISMGLEADGCTSFAWKTDDVSLLAQNWDWEEAQQINLIHTNIKRTSKPSISMITEAGIIGKIGLNSSGVGVCINAIRARGVNFTRLPVHLAIRAALDSTSRAEALAKLDKAGVASAVHLLIGDATGSTSAEYSNLDIIKFEMKDGQIAHSNHFIVPHTEGVQPASFSQDSLERIVRARELLAVAASETEKPPTVRMIEKMLKDEQGLPGAINRVATEKSPSSTLFGIVMDLKEKKASVRIGRPTECKGFVTLNPMAV
ncbi:acyl-CoA:6-aminopenicillanic-acid-acyltransferase [Hyaloscypha variabilis F]|uniref:Acyl-CoA:6-aminopenicillanic-acid-acyltransferase n=1 Tax=Hyaloscypha variabilis (strain UAMH 11265 / GT02V1 / F) TaxID=1149755 RepID=A0A2J6RM74_HYAVF|nr:acyl-CoA:6-aminopenicillanic-acid-acyltransferase [Hyaloscypha variabilis F]